MAVEVEVGNEDSGERYNLINYKVQEHRIGQLWKRFEAAGFKPILIKGWAISLYYPKPWQRQFVDVDLIFDPSEFAAAEEFSKTQSFELAVDLHRGTRHLDTLSYPELLDNSVLKKCGEVEVRVLSEEDHLRILCVHWLNDGGAFEDRLWDIYYAVENRSATFDWDRCLNVVNKRRRRWVVCAIGLAHRYLGLNLDELPFREEAQEVPKWLSKAVEKEWADDVQLLPLHYFVNDRKKFWKQLRKRFPPNAVTATILMDGDFDRYPRFIYQFGNMFTRLFPSLKRLKDTKIK